MENAENKTNVTQPLVYAIIGNPMTLSLEYVVQKREQARTIRNKKEFVGVMKKAMGIVKIACNAVNISRQTYYRWLEEDPAFRAEMDKIRSEQNDEVEDRLLTAIAKDEHWAITLYLNRVHPKYRPKQDQYIHDGAKTLEDLLDADEKKLNEPNEQNNEDKSGADRKTDQDPQQTGSDCSVHTKPGTNIILEPKDTQKPNNQSKAKGAK